MPDQNLMFVTQSTPAVHRASEVASGAQRWEKQLWRHFRQAMGRCLLVTALLTGPSACASLNANGNPAPALEETEYQEWLNRVEEASQNFELIRQLDTRLMGRVTLMTPRLREAWAREYSRLYRLPEAEAGRVLETERRKSAEGLELLVWVAARESKLADLAPATGLWRMSLKGADGVALSPTEVKWERKPDRVMTWFFPHLDPLGRTYRVTFPANSSSGQALADSHPLTFLVAGVQGQVELTWREGVALRPGR